MSTVIHYSYSMGFKIGDHKIPDPSSFSGKESDLDTLGKRTATGTLKRNLVATKHPIKLEYSAMEWDMIKTILSYMTTQDSDGSPISKSKFNFTYPDPGTGTLSTRSCYVGDREWDCTQVLGTVKVGNETKTNVYIGSLKFSIIQI